MKEDVLSKKDIVQGIVVLFVALLGTPLIVWGLSYWHQEYIYKAASEKIEKGLRGQFTAGQRLYDVYLQEEKSLERQWLDLSLDGTLYDTSRLSWNNLPSPTLEDVRDEVCLALSRDVLSDQNIKNFLLETYYGDTREGDRCALRIMTGPTESILIDYRGLSKNSLKNNPEYLADIKRLLATSDPQPVLLHNHKKKREIHAQALISRDPVVFWDLVFRQTDR